MDGCRLRWTNLVSLKMAKHALTGLRKGESTPQRCFWEQRSKERKPLQSSKRSVSIVRKASSSKSIDPHPSPGISRQPFARDRLFFAESALSLLFFLFDSSALFFWLCPKRTKRAAAKKQKKQYSSNHGFDILPRVGAYGKRK